MHVNNGKARADECMEQRLAASLKTLAEHRTAIGAEADRAAVAYRIRALQTKTKGGNWCGRMDLNPHGHARSVCDGLKIAAQSTDSGAALKELEGLACFSHA